MDVAFALVALLIVSVLTIAASALVLLVRLLRAPAPQTQADG